MYHPFKTVQHTKTERQSMSSVSAELAALRAKGTVRSQAQQLSSMSPRNLTLSTPEAEEAALKAKREKDKQNKVQAMEDLRKNNAGINAQEMEHSMKERGKKREEWSKKREAKEILKKGASSSTAAVGFGVVGASAASGASAKDSGGDAAGAEKKKKPVDKVAALTEDRPKVVELAASLAADIATTSPEEATVEAENAANNANATKDAFTNDDDNDAAADNDEDIPELEEEPETQPNNQNETQGHTADATEDHEIRQITNRNEKKSRKMMQRLGMRPVSGIARVTIKTGGNRGYFVIDSPDVFCNNGSGKNDTYVIFGEAKQGGGFGGLSGGAGATAQAQAAAMAQAQAAVKMGGKAMESVREEEEEAEKVGDDANGAGGEQRVDESGVEAKDIELVMSQASCSRAKAVAALKENDNDLVNAIMSLTT